MNPARDGMRRTFLTAHPFYALLLLVLQANVIRVAMVMYLTKVR